MANDLVPGYKQLNDELYRLSALAGLEVKP